MRKRYETRIENNVRLAGRHDVSAADGSGPVPSSSSRNFLRGSQQVRAVQGNERVEIGAMVLPADGGYLRLACTDERRVELSFVNG